MHAVLQWAGVPFRMCPFLMASLPRISCGFTATLTWINQWRLIYHQFYCFYKELKMYQYILPLWGSLWWKGPCSKGPFLTAQGLSFMALYSHTSPSYIRNPSICTEVKCQATMHFPSASASEWSIPTRAINISACLQHTREAPVKAHPLIWTPLQ